MGTSTHNRGQNGRTPLVPSWLEQPDNDIQIPPDGDADRFRVPRNEFTRYINSGGRDTSLGRRSISNYIKNSLGGSTNATHRLGAARKSSAKLIDFAGIYASGGVEAVEKYFSIDNLSNRTASNVFISLTNFICPDGGPQDEGIARDAYISAIEETPELAEIKFEDLTSDQFMIIVERTMANVICNRITNDIANKIIALPQDQNTTKSLISQIKDFVKGAVSESVSHLNIKAGNLPQGDTLKIVDQVYKTSFDIMVSVGES